MSGSIVDAMRSDEYWMRQALEQAQAAESAGEVPVGAVLLHGGAVLARGGNRPIATHDPTAHAEIVALRAAAAALGDYRLTGSTLYVTLVPCVLCALALVHARVQRVVFGAFDPRAGAAGSRLDVFRLSGQNHRVDVLGGVLAADCQALLDRFFTRKRAPR
jgi:tRNA(adenine34) deaminase